MCTLVNDPNEINQLILYYDPESIEITATATIIGDKTLESKQGQTISLALNCGQKLKSLGSKAIATYKGGKCIDVSDKTSWEWNSKPRATGKLVTESSLLDGLTKQFEKSTNKVTIKARVENAVTR